MTRVFLQNHVIPGASSWPSLPLPLLIASWLRLPGWREALMTILLGSVVAYVANDSGAAALGLGFGMASVGLMSATLRTGAIPEQRVSVANRAHMIEHT